MQVLGKGEVGNVRKIISIYDKTESHYLPLWLFVYLIVLITAIGHILMLTI